jgi:hypothetical protein
MDVCEDVRKKVEVKSEDDSKDRPAIGESDKKKELPAAPKKVVGSFSVAHLISEDDEQKKEPSVGFSITSLVADCDTRAVNEAEPPQTTATPFIISNLISTDSVKKDVDLVTDPDRSASTSCLKSVDVDHKDPEEQTTNLESSAEPSEKVEVTTSPVCPKESDQVEEAPVRSFLRSPTIEAEEKIEDKVSNQEEISVSNALKVNHSHLNAFVL